MKISLVKRKTKSLEEFEREEWAAVDLEQFGVATLDFKPRFFYLKAQNNGQVVGTLQMRIRAGVCTINDLIVAKESRGQGIGTKLMHEAERIAKEEKAHKIFLITGNKWRAADFYKGLGYQITGERLKDFMGTDFFEFSKFI